MVSIPRAAAAALAVAVTLLAAPAVPAQAPSPGSGGPSLDDFGLLVATQSRPSFSILGAGARAAGMGGAFTALADDASAASFNPAGLALLLEPEASAVFDASRRRDRHHAFTDVEDGALELYGPSSASFDTAGVNFASFTVPTTVARRNLSLQLSFHRLIDFAFDTERRFSETTAAGTPIAGLVQRIDQSGDVSTVSLAAAYQLTQRLSLGLTVSRWIGGWSFDTTTRQREAGESEETSLRFHQENDWSGWNYTAGLLLRYRYLNVGAAYRSQFAGDYRVRSRLDASFDTPFADASSFEGSLLWPNSWTLGLAVKPLQTWFLTVDFAQFDWDDMVIRGLGPEGRDEVNFFDLRPSAETTARHAGQWRVGSEVTLFSGDDIVALRGGWFVEPRPQLLAPGDEKSSVRGLTAGVGWRRGPLSLDLAYQHATSSSRILQFVDPETVASGVVAAQAEGDVDTTRDRLFLSVLYQLETRDKLRDLFHFLFVGPLDREAEDGEAEPKKNDEGGEARGSEVRGEEERGGRGGPVVVGGRAPVDGGRRVGRW
jgi:hypothetical protein